MLVGDVRVDIDQLEGYYVFAIGLVVVIGVTDHMTEHNSNVSLWFFKSFEFSYENCSIFVLFSNIINWFLETNRFTGGIGSDI